MTIKTKTDFYENGQMSFKGNYKDLREDGEHIYWYENGQIRSKASYTNGELDDKYIEWNENSQKIVLIQRVKSKRYYYDIKTYYDNGRKSSEGCSYQFRMFDDSIGKDGLWINWYENGQMKSKANYVSGGALTGEYFEWYENGQMKSKCKYSNNFKEGIEITYYSDGKKLSEGSFSSGRKNDLWINWYENGQMKSKVNYRTGRLDGEYIEWHKNGRKAIEGFRKELKKDGWWISWDMEGNVVSEVRYEYKNTGPFMYPSETGKLTAWFKNGQKASETEYLYFDKSGQFMSWYEDGQKKAKGNYKAGVKVGQWAYWDNNNNVSYQENMIDYYSNEAEGVDDLKDHPYGYDHDTDF